MSDNIETMKPVIVGAILAKATPTCDPQQAIEVLAGALALLRNRFNYYVEYHEASGNQAKADSNRFYVKLADAVLEAVGKGGVE